ncbi:hypothetical protein ACJJTC_011790 [Scirpophaga incertulas]
MKRRLIRRSSGVNKTEWAAEARRNSPRVAGTNVIIYVAPLASRNTRDSCRQIDEAFLRYTDAEGAVKRICRARFGGGCRGSGAEPPKIRARSESFGARDSRDRRPGSPVRPSFGPPTRTHRSRRSPQSPLAALVLRVNSGCRYFNSG